VEGHFLGLSEDELDQHIYRIMPQNYAIALFTERQNVLSQVHNWKDKFENFQLKLGGILNGKPFEYGFRHDFVGQCWTRNSLSEAMWGIYASDPTVQYIRIRSTPRKLLTALAASHPRMSQETCFIGAVDYKSIAELKAYALRGVQLKLEAKRFAESLLLKRRAFVHESEVRLLYFGEAKEYDSKGLYRYPVDPHAMITQIMADPTRNRANWRTDKATLAQATGFTGKIKRSMIYDPPEWAVPTFKD
jgi:hypothetical protein